MIKILDKVDTKLGTGIVSGIATQKDASLICDIAMDVLITEDGEPILFTEEGYYKTTNNVFITHLVHTFKENEISVIQ